MKTKQKTNRWHLWVYGRYGPQIPFQIEYIFQLNATAENIARIRFRCFNGMVSM